VQKCTGVFRARKFFRSRVSAIGSQVQVFRFGYRFRTGIFPHPHLHLITRTRDLRAETWDPKMYPAFAPLHRPQADLHFCTKRASNFYYRL
jgi:hypothetical protein